MLLAKIFVLCSSLITATLALASAKSPDQKVEVKGLEDELIWLLVEKDDFKATLMTLPEFPKQPVTLQSFRIAVGREKGDKMQTGDKRTPEGVYFTLSHVPEERLLFEKYGRVAVPLDYPNVVDKLDGRTGSGIWLHGAGNDNRIAAENVSEGCVEFYNDDIVKLKNWLVPQQGIVMISQDAKNVNQARDREEVSDLTRKWYTAWTNRDLSAYISHYSPHFEHEGRKVKAYENYKSRVFHSYKAMTVKTETLRVLTHPKYAVAIMNQTVNGDHHFHSEGRKVLYWRKEDGAWKIARETFSKISLSKHNLSEHSLQSLRPMLTQKP